MLIRASTATRSHSAALDTTPTDSVATDQPPFTPDLDRILAAGHQHGTRFFPDFTWPDA